MNIHLFICFITNLHMKVNFKISYELSVMNLVLSSVQLWDLIWKLEDPSINSPIVYFLHSQRCWLNYAKPVLSCTHVCSFLCATEDGIQSAFQNRLIALLLFNCPFQLSQLRMESEKEISSELKQSNSTSLFIHLSYSVLVIIEHLMVF